MKKLMLGLLSAFVFTSISQAGNIEMVPVTKHKEITKKFSKKVKTGESCWEEVKIHREPCGGQPRVDKNSIGLDTIIGTTLGVVVGNQIGKGNGRTAAKIVGGLSGGYIANSTRGGSQSMCEVRTPITKCKNTYDYVTEYRVMAYNNCANVDGQKICKRTKHKLDYLKIEKIIKVW